jgi:hypothetical protein
METVYLDRRHDSVHATPGCPAAEADGTTLRLESALARGYSACPVCSVDEN